MLLRIGAALGLLGMVAAQVRADQPWTSFAVKDGVTFERMLAGSQYFEHRAQTLIAATPGDVLAAIWRNIADAPPETVTKRVVLARSATQVLVYDEIHSTVVTDRDVVIAIRRVDHPEAKKFEVRFDTMNGLGPPPDGKHIRIPVVRGSWSLATAPSGGTLLTYVCYSEPGGAVPPVLVRGTLQNQVIMDVKRILSSFPH